MKVIFKEILKALHLYHPIQLSYRQFIFFVKKNISRITYRRYKGHGYTCNFCGNSYSKFVPGYPSQENAEAIRNNKVIAGYGDNVFCPFCMSTARERLVKAMLEKMELKQKKILHLSPEKKIHDFLFNKADIISGDLVPGFYRNVDKHISHTDATALTFESESFDMVIANHIFEHIPDDRKAMQEIFRVLKKGSTAILQVPYSREILDTIEQPDINNPGKQSRLFGQKDHVRIYNCNDYMNRLRNAGFTVEFISYETLANLYRFAIQPEEGFFKIRK